MDVERLHELEAAPGTPISLELPVGEDEEQELGDVLADETSTSPEEVATTRTMKQEVQDVLEDVLTPRERLVLQLRFGLGNGHTFPLEQVGRQLGITRERVRQIEAGALAKLRHPKVLERLRSSARVDVAYGPDRLSGRVHLRLCRVLQGGIVCCWASCAAR
jgi:RNA polymerase primary sigma factor